MTSPGTVRGESTVGLRARLQELGERERQLLLRLQRRELVARNVDALEAERLILGNRVADRFAVAMGSWRFIVLQSVVLVVWVILNSVAWARHWDPYPFILLNLALSFQAAYAAPTIMMSQNRQEAKDRLRAEHDYEVNLEAELGLDDLRAKVDALRQAQWEELLELQRRQLALLQQLPSERPAETD